MIAAVCSNVTKPACQFCRLSTGSQIARRRGNLGYDCVNKSLFNAGSAHRGRPIKLANLLDRARKSRSTNLRHIPTATKSP
jgi:hypothetical protein